MSTCVGYLVHPVVPPRTRNFLRTPEALFAENAILRHQLTVSSRRSTKPRFRAWDRFLLVALARMSSNWRAALVIVKPDTLLRWHREGFRLLWKWRSRRKPPAPPRVPPDVVDLIRRMATENRLWGTERIRGELLKLVAKRTIQRYLSKPADVLRILGLRPGSVAPHGSRDGSGAGWVAVRCQ